MTQDGPPLAKLPDGRLLAFTMEIRDWIDALLWEDEEHDPWTEQNLEIRYVADAASDGVPPAVRGWELILECARADYENTKVKDVGELCREIILTLTDEDPGEWHEKMAKIIFDEVRLSRVKSGYRSQQISRALFDEVASFTPEESVEAMQEFLQQMKRRRRKN